MRYGFEVGIEMCIARGVEVTDLTSKALEVFRLLLDIGGDLIHTTWVAFAPSLVLLMTSFPELDLILLALPLPVALSLSCIALELEFPGMDKLFLGQRKISSDTL